MFHESPIRKITRMTRLLSVAGYVGQSLRLMAGVPEYSAYVAHMRSRHPNKPPMSYQEFFQECQTARYDGRVGRCC
ncbi:Uncharacterized short protein YbdD, DUF466 family [Nitrosospira sp. Nsp18]|nr:Uncharacterized short protein YbdD, DUF466 family [Nitrosospira sp. Nsp18]